MSSTMQAARTLYSKASLLFDNIKFAHSIFALPFAVLTAFVVSDGWPPIDDLLIGIVATISLRAFALSLNRLIDREIDRANLRTSSRPLARGALGMRETLLFALLTLALSVGLFFYFHPYIWLAVVPLVAVMVIYPYLKRFTWLCHLGIGVIYLLLPIAVELALAGTVSLSTVLVGAAGLLWVTGFDILYSLGDYEHDIQHGIYSVSARFGMARAIWTTRIMHLLTAALLIALGLVLEFGIIYYVGTAVTMALLLYENVLVSPGDLSRLNTAFFRLNGIIAVVFCAFVCLEVLVR